MSERAPIFLTEPLVQGFGTAEWQTFVTVDTGFVVDGWPVYRLELRDSAAGGHWEPVTNGDPDNPELVFYEGDIVVYWVTD